MLPSRRVVLLSTLLVLSVAIGYVIITMFPDEDFRDIEDVVITMERGPCLGFCPVYSLIVYGNGTVIYDGEMWVNVIGRQVYEISQAKVKELVDEFYRIDYFSLEDRYVEPVMDLSSTTTLFMTGGKTKSVYNYGYEEAPERLFDLENKIDEITNSSKWVEPHPIFG